MENGPFRVIWVDSMLHNVDRSVVTELLGDQDFKLGQDGHVLGEILFMDL